MQQRAELDRLRRATLVQAARVGQPLLHQSLHGVEVGLDAPAQTLVVHLFGAQAQAGDRGLKVVRDRRQDAGTLGDVLGDALLHLVEGDGGPGHLGGAADINGGARRILAEGACCVGHARQRPGGDTHRDPGEQSDAERERGERGQKGPWPMQHDRGRRRDPGQAHLQRRAIGERKHDQQAGVGAVVARMHVEGRWALRHCRAQCRLQGMLVAERAQVFARRAQCEAQPAAADVVDPALALRWRHVVEQVGDAGDLLCHALEQRAAADALALAEEQRQAHRQHERHADQPDQHQAGEQAARQGKLHRGALPSGATTLTSAAST